MNTNQGTRPYIGGQAVIEGVFMRAPRAIAIAVRAPDGRIKVKTDPYLPFFQRFRFFRLPFLRGVFVMIDALVLGMRALSWSAEQASEEEDPPVADDSTASETQPEAPQRVQPTQAQEADEVIVVDTHGESNLNRRDKLALTGTLIFSLLLGLGLFVALPHLLTDGIGWLSGTALDVEGVAFHLIDGTVKLAIFLAYLGLIRRHPEIRRVFQYHGAEHKTIYAWESGLDLTIDNVRIQSRFKFHPAPGRTSFQYAISP